MCHQLEGLQGRVAADAEAGAQPGDAPMEVGCEPAGWQDPDRGSQTPEVHALPKTDLDKVGGSWSVWLYP